MGKNVKIDLHVHSKNSYDSFASISGILNKAFKENLYVAITDHNKLTKVNHKLIIPGEEIKTDVGDIIGLFLKEEINDYKFENVIKEIRRQDGIVVLPHPFRGHRNLTKVCRKVDFIEAFNGREKFDNILRSIRLASKMKKPIVAGSDAHLIKEIGNCVVLTKKPIKYNLLEGNYSLLINGLSSYFNKFLTSRIIKFIKTFDTKIILNVITNFKRRLK